jgi:plasmid stability protein
VAGFVIIDCNASSAYISPMSTTLTIRNLNEDVKQLLRVRAATHGRAMEAEARDILTKAVMGGAGNSEQPPKAPRLTVKSVCGGVRGTWKGRLSSDKILDLTRGDS